MQIDDAEDALKIPLERDPVANVAEIMAKMQIAGGLDAGKNAVHLASDKKRATPVIAAKQRWSSRLPAQPPQELAPIGDTESERKQRKARQSRPDQRHQSAETNKWRGG